MSRTRKLSVEVSGEDKSAGKTLKGVGDDADKLSKQLKKAGEESGKGFGSGFQKGMPSKKDAEGIGDSISSGLTKALAAGGLAAAAVFAVGFMQHLDNEFAVDKLQAQLGNGEWAKDAGEVAGDLYLDGFGSSVGDTAATVKGVIQFDLVGEEATKADLEDISTLVSTFTDVLDQDLNMSLQAVSAMLRNDLAKDGEEALDILTTGIQSGANRAEDLLETFQEYSSLFRDLGLDGKRALGLIRQGLQGGARDADKVADALKEFAIRGQDASELSARGFWLLGIKAGEATRKIAAGGEDAAEMLDLVLDRLRNMEDPVKRNEAAIALFGTQAEDLGDALYALDPSTAVEALGEMTGKTEELGTAYDNAKTKIETFKREALEKLTTFIGEQVIPRIESFVGWIEENQEVAAVLAIIVGTTLVGAMAAYAVAATVAAGATILATWPFWLAVAAVAALAAGLYALTHREGEGFLRWVARIAITVYAAALTIVSLFRTLWAWANTAVNAIRRVVDAIGDVGRAINQLPGGGIFGNVLGGMNGVFNLVPGLASGGPVAAGSPYIVGEEGPELFVPSTSGAIVPNDWTSTTVVAGGSREVPVVIELDGQVLGRAMIRFDADHRARNGRSAFGG